MLRSFACAVLLGVLAPAAAGQPIETDRPDFTESTETVPAGRLQLEAGTSAARLAGTTSVSGPELLVRAGVLPRLELRVELPDYINAGASGFSDAAAGGKVRIGPFGGWGLAAIAMVTLPVGDSVFSSGHVDPSLTATASRNVGRFSLGLQAGAARLPGESRTELATTLVVGTDLSDGVGSFVEFAAGDIAGDPSVVFHHGYTISLRDALQLDIHAGAGLAGDAPAWLIGAGLGVGIGRGDRDQ